MLESYSEISEMMKILFVLIAQLQPDCLTFHPPVCFPSRYPSIPAFRGTRLPTPAYACLYIPPPTPWFHLAYRSYGMELIRGWKEATGKAGYATCGNR